MLGDNRPQPQPQPMDTNRKRLLFRSRHMGTVENDTVVGGFAEAYLPSLSDEQVTKFEKLLDVNDTDLFLWITGAQPVPPDHDHDVMRMMRDFLASRGRSETPE